MFRKSALIVFCLLLLQTVVAAQHPAEKVSYENLLARVKSQDVAVNFQELRLAYTETKQYSPYGGDREARKAMFAALKTEEYEKALAASEKILAANYLDINAHLGAYIANRELGHAERADYHKNVFQKLLKSISDSGNGKTVETAFIVISTDEEYALFNFMGLRPTAQELIEDKTHHYDKMTVTDPNSNQNVIYYFNIDIPFNWLGNSFKN
ncbi:MAG TPA: DUF4919 domain-containing protein [Pyrinomonadaceae bacterium]|nr:DUF4919 domain-containing protein [Pyrinomonadaceae bacterium]